MKVLAVSAPHWVSNKSTATDLTFNSQTPFSLHNALRDAVNEAETNIKSRWWNSNLKDFQKRNESVLLLEFWEQDKENFELAFNKINPDILFIGAMTLSFPGAIEIAKYAKQKKGENIFIVLGGKHVNETFFKNREGLYSHHVGSPLKLMEENSIPQIFDLVISGNAEKVITKIGEIIGGLKKRGGSFSHFFEKTNILKLEQSEGDWIGGALFKNKLHYFESSIKTPINYLTLAHAVGQYNLTKGFKIFNTDYTIHGYSDTSLGCGFDCFFCSEKSSINGKIRIKSTVP
ncbi:MAG: hypothetical protein KDE33_25590, partial [Bacteroidetes bacterium]|nr:hypothetical protein [Bacteroidota bacterium]